MWRKKTPWVIRNSWNVNWIPNYWMQQKVASKSLHQDTNLVKKIQNSSVILKGMPVERPKKPLELEIKDNYVKIQNNFNYCSHFQDHSNAYEIFHLGSISIAKSPGYKTICSILSFLWYIIIPGKKERTTADIKLLYCFCFSEESYIVFHAKNSQKL